MPFPDPGGPKRTIFIKGRKEEGFKIVAENYLKCFEKRPFMDLSNTPIRQKLESLLHPAPGRCVNIDFDLVEQAGLTIVERRIPAVDEAQNYKCAQFVLRTISTGQTFWDMER